MAKRTPQKFPTRDVAPPQASPDSSERSGFAHTDNQYAAELDAILTGEGTLLASHVAQSGDVHQTNGELLLSFEEASRDFISSCPSGAKHRNATLHLRVHISGNSSEFPEDDYTTALEQAFEKTVGPHDNYCHVAFGAVELTLLLTPHDKPWQPHKVSDNELLIRLPNLSQNVSPKEAAQRTLDVLSELCMPLRERWLSYEKAHGRALDETKHPEVARVRTAIQFSEEQVDEQDDKPLPQVASSQELIKRACTIVQGALPPRSVCVTIARRLNQCIERFNRIDSKEIEADEKKQLVDAINRAKTTLGLESRLTESVAKLPKGTPVWITFQPPSGRHKTGRFVVQRATKSAGQRRSANLTHALPITLTVKDDA